MTTAFEPLSQVEFRYERLESILALLAIGLRLRVGVRALRREVGDLEQLIGALDAASSRSATALAGLKGAAERAAEQLTATQRLLDDLRFLTERGGQIADRLEEGIRGTRAAGARPASSRPATDSSGHAGHGAAATLSDELQRTLMTLR